MSDRMFALMYMVGGLYAIPALVGGYAALWWFQPIVAAVLLPLAAVAAYAGYRATRTVIGTFRYDNILWDHPRYGVKK